MWKMPLGVMVMVNSRQLTELVGCTNSQSNPLLDLSLKGCVFWRNSLKSPFAWFMIPESWSHAHDEFWQFVDVQKFHFSWKLMNGSTGTSTSCAHGSVIDLLEEALIFARKDVKSHCDENTSQDSLNREGCGKVMAMVMGPFFHCFWAMVCGCIGTHCHSTVWKNFPSF